MSYQISWHQENEIILLEVAESLDLASMNEINQNMVELLDKAEHKLILLVNAEALKIGHHTVNLLRNSQKYANHPKLKMMISFAPDKLTRLIFLMAFSMSSASLTQFEDIQELNQFLKRLSSRSSNS